jgi:hypothetical protein
MFVSDAHLYVPREIRWSRVLAVRFTAMRRRKPLARRLMRDVRAMLPVAGLVMTFAVTVATAEFTSIAVPTGAEQSPAVQSVQDSVARLLAPSPVEPSMPAPVAAPATAPVAKAPAVDDRLVVSEKSLPAAHAARARATIAMLD